MQLFRSSGYIKHIRSAPPRPRTRPLLGSDEMVKMLAAEFLTRVSANDRFRSNVLPTAITAEVLPPGDHSVGPFDKVFHVGPVFMPAVVLSPGQFAIEQPGVHRRHFGGAIIFLFSDVSHAEQPEDRAGGNSGHVAALLIQPIGITPFRHPVADES